ncbi:class I SAM-dependent methyltransferase [Pseudodesulfovibrio sp. zrk46]|uniref:class I SAM-dependent methyltransferase n=1 Tax=Pseudodesulfovibrio sp. zrk46 TaxID=2725288 RepID=UPI001449DF7F|nr:class I SAM-dependent methyltransferase [Pseudodesulfovibrio sp. zrk46]QJB55739.1 class I SAM-dependent methyltransferase [Pseudodesulfovibrio sp. zrk46]
MKYKSNLENKNGAHYKVVTRIPRKTDVLELGCAQGYMTEYLRDELGCRVWGVEIEAEAAGRAGNYAEQMIVADIDRDDWQSELTRKEFDVIVMADVLEHLKHPATALRKCRELLAPGGQIVLSLPNVSHQLVIAMLLCGEFSYGQVGLLDNTHLRFFTPKSFNRLVNENGYEIVDRDDVVSPEPKGDQLECLTTVQKSHPGLFDDMPHALVYQFIYVLRPKGQGGK